jgi:hypothetical protein
MKMSKVQSERVFKCDHLGQSTTVTFILLPFLEGTVLSRIYGPNWVWHCSTALLNPRPVYSCGWRCSKLHQLQSYTITIPYCPWHLGYGKRTTGQTDRNTGSWHQVRWASMHSRGSVFPRLRRIKGSVQFLESLLFLMCSSICSHLWCPLQKEKEKRNLGAPHNKLICHTIKLHRTSLNSPDVVLICSEN